jgi:ribosomal protein S27E
MPTKCIVCKKKHPVFAHPGDKIAKHCGDCKLPGMEDIKNPKCIVCKKKQPVFAHPGDKIAKHCGDCKLQGMEDIKHPKCIVCKKKHPVFAHPGDKIAKHCGDCKLPGMEDIKSPKCIVCKKKQPVFAHPGDKIAKHCGDCKLQGMEDIKSPKCIVCKKKQPVFAQPGDKIAKHCGDCKLLGMEDIKSPKCIVCKKKQPVFAHPGDKQARHCGDCKLQGMEDIKNPKCKSEWCSTFISNKQYEGYCAYCFRHMFPDKQMARNYKTKESAVVQYILQHFSHIDIVTDKIIQGGCSKRRPDIFIDLGYQILIIEIDENQHTDYDCSCENKRMMELSQDVGHRPIIFIRFNPDDYKTQSGNVTSCWGVNKQGLCNIKKCKQKEWSHRLESLKENINYWMQPDNVTHKVLEVVHLYYDTV